MSYSQILKHAIDEKKMSYKEISNECVKLGVSIVPSYISKLVNDEMSPPTKQKSKALAKVLEIDENELIIESYLDRAPKEIIDFLNYARASVLTATMKIFDNNFTKEDFANFQEAFKQMSLSKFLIQTKDQLNFEASNLDDSLKYEYVDEGENTNVTVNIKDPIGITVQDDSMFPIITKGSEITLEVKNQYVNGEILFVKSKSFDNPQSRKYFFLDDKIMLCPINTDYETITVDKNDVQILGRVRKVIKTLE